MKHPSNALDGRLEYFFLKNKSLLCIEKEIIQGYEVLSSCISNGNKIMTCGNGGSAADANHIVGELVKSFAIKRELPCKDKEKIKSSLTSEADNFIQNLEGGIPAISLIENSSFLTAFANDINYEYAIAQSLYVLGKEKDVLIAISTSGNSQNIINAAKLCHAFGIRCIGLTGNSGGKLADIADVAIQAPSEKTHEIQEFHLPIYHFWCSLLELEFFHPEFDRGFDFSNYQKSMPTENIKLMIFDFDGVFTDNKVYSLSDGNEAIVCDKADSLGLNFLKKGGIKPLIVSMETNEVVKKRCEKMRVSYFVGIDNKIETVKKIAKEQNLRQDQIAYVGNDINDLEAMEWVTMPIAVADAHPKIKSVAKFISRRKGGHGAVRDAVEFVLNI
ncbi:MAG: SIS domain-containing protein [Oligoflexales bacterium]